MKKLTVCLRAVFVLTLIFALSFNSATASLDCFGEAAFERELDAYVLSQIGGYLGGIGMSSDDSISITQGFKVENTPIEQHQRSYFVFEDNTIIGQLDVSVVDNNFVSSFVIGNFDYLSEVVKDNESIAIYEDDGGRAICTKDDSITINGNRAGKKGRKKENAKLEKVIKKNISNKVNYKVESYNLALKNTQGSSKESQGKQIDLDYLKGLRYEYDLNTTPESAVDVEETLCSKTTAANKVLNASQNGTDPFRFLNVDLIPNQTIGNVGVCWAACGASVINYKTGSNLNATSVYNALKSEYNATPTGETLWLNRMWEHYGLTMTHKYHKLSYSTVCDQLLAGNPIYCNIRSVNASENVGHIIVLMGTYAQDGKVYYIYMDPNIAKIPNNPCLVINSVVPSTLNTTHTYVFYYTAWGSYYNNWIETYY